MQTVREREESIIRDNLCVGKVETRIVRGWGSKPKFYVYQRVCKYDDKRAQMTYYNKTRSLSWASRWFNGLVG